VNEKAIAFMRLLQLNLEEGNVDVDELEIVFPGERTAKFCFVLTVPEGRELDFEL